MSTAPLFEKKTVYHSQLVNFGPVMVTITSEPQKSKFQKGGVDSYYVEFKADGHLHQLTIENDAVKDALTGYKGQTVTLEASGSRDDADIIVSGGTQQARQQPQQQGRTQQGRQQTQPQQGRQQQAPQDHQAHDPSPTPPPTTTDGQMKLMRAYMMKCAVLMQLSRNAAIFILGDKAEPDDIRAATATLFIECARNAPVPISNLPTVVPGKAAPAAQRPAAPQQPAGTQQPAGQQARQYGDRPGNRSPEHPDYDPAVDPAPDDIPF